MKLHFAVIPALDPVEATRALNQFLGANRVVSVDKTLVPDGPASFWSVCVTYLDGEQAVAARTGKKSLDYREVLTDAEFRKFAALRELRKSLAQADGLPASTLAITAHADATTWRREQLRRVPTVDA